LVIEEAPNLHVQRLVAALRTSGFDVRLASNIVAMQWAKLVMNLNNAVSALSDVPTRELLLSKGYRAILAAIISEAIAVMRRAGVRPASLTGLPVALLPPLLRLPTWVVRTVARTQLKIDPEARSSMWEDLMKHRTTEVDDLNGHIVRLAESVGMQAPLNRRIVEVIHRVEQERRGSPRLGPEALWSLLTGPQAAT
jgi:2-dehydropantoate 2-reductase